jgi:CDP-paratose 2-epimerase
MKKALVTGSCGLIGSQSVKFLIDKGYDVYGIDNDMRKYFFGNDSSTNPMKNELLELKNYHHFSIDIRDYNDLKVVFGVNQFDIIIHTAAQPSHDWAANEPLTDFTINAMGTMNMLEITRLNCPKATFIFTSTNKVYGDTPNKLNIQERDTRYEYVMDYGGFGLIGESMSIDDTKHSVFGASKVAADIMCQEYGKYFGMNVGIFRGGCLTGPGHQGAELHGFLSYLIKCIVFDKPYTIFGYKGKQVRDNIHSWDLVNMFWEFHQNPKQGEVYNVGGGRDNSISILETINYVNEKLNKNWDNFKITDTPRVGDHIWYITDLNKFKKDYPEWNIKYSVYDTIDQIIEKNLEKI